MADPFISSSYYHRASHSQRPDLADSYIPLSDHMSAFFKKLNKSFIIVILIPVYFLAIGFSFFLRFIFQKKDRRGDTYWEKSEKIDKASYYSAY